MKSTERWSAVQAVVSEALELPPDERDRHVSDQCSHDPELLRDVEELLRACREAEAGGGFLESPAFELLEAVVNEVRELEASHEHSPEEIQSRLQSALVDRYAIRRELGRGGMATVFLADDLRHGRQVAIKVMRPELHGIGAQRFLREIRTLAGLSHPHVLPLHDSGEADGLLYFVTPFIEGESLRRRLTREGKLPLPDIQRILRELGDALAFAHAHGVVHRDIKPENILLQNGHAVLADFGIARALDNALSGGPQGNADGLVTPFWFGAGTPAYMAPEQATPGAHTDHRVDLYALGVVAYEMLTGERPFHGPPPEAQQSAPLSATPSPVAVRRSDVPSRLAAVVEKLIARSPADRHATASEVVRDLEGLDSGEAALVRGRGPARKYAIGGSIAAIVVLGGGILLREVTGADLLPGKPDAVALDSSRVVVAAFRPLGASGRDSASLAIEQLTTDWLTRGLLQTGLVTVVPAGALVDPSAGGDGETERRLLEAARSVGAGLLISGTHYRERDSLFLVATISDVRTGQVRRALAPVAAPVSSPMEAVDRLRQRVVGTLAQAVDPRMANWSHVASAPSTYEAYQVFAEGLRVFFDESGGDPNPYFRRAHALDTTFLTPLLWMFFDRGAQLPGEGDRLRAYLLERRERAPAWDQGLIDWITRKNQEEGYAAFRRVVRAAPQSEWLYMLAWTARETNRPATAVRVLENLDYNRGWLRGWVNYWGVLASAHHYLGEYDKELAALRRGFERFPNHKWLVIAQVQALAAIGAPRDELERAVAALSYDLPQFADYAISFVVPLRELLRHGRKDVADSAGNRLLREIDRGRASMPELRYVQRRFEILWALNRWEDAAPLLEWMVQRSDLPLPRPMLYRRQAFLAASRGLRAEAESLALEGRRPPGSDASSAARLDWERFTTGAMYALSRAAIDAQLGEADRAIARLRAARVDRDGVHLLHYQAPLDPLYGHPEYEKLAATHYDDPDVFPRVRRNWFSDRLARR